MARPLHSWELDWTPQLVSRLVTLHNLGWSNRQIALDIGVSRNAVIGKAHRLRLGPRVQAFSPTCLICGKPSEIARDYCFVHQRSREIRSSR